MPVIYKPIVEVQLLHEYYLTDGNGQSIFDLTQPAAREEFLRKRLEKEIPSITNDLDIELMPGYNDPRLKVAKTYAGFRLFAEVNQIQQPDGSKWYLPKYLPPLVPVMLINKTGEIDIFTHSRLSNYLRANYYFTNHDVPGPKIFPLLTENIPLHTPGTAYEQGDLASFGPGDIRRFYVNDSGDQWDNVTGAGFISPFDRILVPQRFEYTFNATESILDATFVLKAQDGTTVSTIDISDTKPITKAWLDFTGLQPLTVPDAISIYTLEVSTDTSFSQKHRLVFMDPQIPQQDLWGLVHLGATTNSTDYSLLDSNGFLKTKKDPSGTIVSMPVLQINMKSRITYWRYVHNQRKKLAINAITDPHLVEVEGKLVTKMPKELTYLPGLFKKPDNSFQPLPNPPGDNMIGRENNRLYSDIVVTESTLFPLAP